LVSLTLVAVLAVLSYCLGYMHGSYQTPQVAKTEPATVGQLKLGDPGRILKDEPTIKYGPYPGLPDTSERPVEKFWAGRPVDR
jgi:hypothetical protein